MRARLIWTAHSRCTADPTLMLLLDWCKAFDKVRHEALFLTLERMQIPMKFINLVKAAYHNPTFDVCIDKNYSKAHKQETGIRQGCPLSPYLFLLVMTALFEDVHLKTAECKNISNPVRII